MRYQMPEGVLRAQLDGDEVLLNPVTGVYHLLNATGRELVEGFDRGLTFEESVDALASRTGGERDQVLSDADSFVTAMLERGVLEEVP